MKNEQHNDLNPFEAPANLWERVEAGLDQQKSKRRGIIWWYIAAGIALLGGIGYTLSTLSLNKTYVREELTAEADIPAIPADTIPSEVEDTTRDEQEFSYSYIKPLAYGPEISDSLNITTPLPFTSNSTQNPFGNGGGQGGGSGTGIHINQLNATNMTLPPAPSAYMTINTPTAQSYSYTSPRVSSGITESPALLYAVPGVSSSSPSTNYQGFIAPPSSGGPVNVATNGVLDGVYIQEHIPTKRMISYAPTGADGIQNENIGRLGSYEQRSSPSYESIPENAFKPTSEDPLSTFSIDVDGASYSYVRGMINRNTLPNPNAVRLEEFINYFPYEYAEPTGEHPFSIHTEFTACPWNSKHQLLKIGIKGESMEKAQLPKNNLVFLLDVSGSMNSPEKLTLLKKGFRLLVNELREEDRIAIAVYAGAAGLVLPPTSGSNKDQILDALNKLQAGGSTAGGEGINLAYTTAEKYFDPTGNNRIILATDGDFNVGVSNNDALVKLIEEKRKSGVFLTVLGFGHDNFQSDKMEKIANNGNGNFSFIDNILEAKKVLVTEMGATLKTIAKDVKIQVEFNPIHVGSYRLLGYENRMLQHQDFANDTVDAGELGAGHTVTAVYEIIPPGVESDTSPADGTTLKYTQVERKASGYFASELATIKFRYKDPEPKGGHADGAESKLIEHVVINSPEMKGSSDFEFIQAVIEFGLLMRQSQYAGTSNYDDILERASNATGDDPFGYRREFIMLVEKAKLLADPLEN